MKELIYRLFAYFISALLGISFYFTIFQLFKFNPVIGLALISSVIFIAVVLVREKDFVKEVAEH